MLGSSLRALLYDLREILVLGKSPLSQGGDSVEDEANVVADALNRKERVKPKRVRAMNMTLQSSIKDRMLAAQKEACDEST
nr:putative reverse transcriptase domain-containing protein [Tanacetum cinerariifolium]